MYVYLFNNQNIVILVCLLSLCKKVTDYHERIEIILLKGLFKNFLLLFNYSCLHFLPIPPPHPSWTHLPPPWFCPCVLHSSSCNPLSSLSPPHSPLDIVILFLISMSLVIFCLLFSSVNYVPVKGEIIWYLSLTTWFISLGIMLSSSNEWIKKLWYIYTMQFYSAERKKELIPFAKYF